MRRRRPGGAGKKNSGRVSRKSVPDPGLCLSATWRVVLSDWKEPVAEVLRFAQDDKSGIFLNVSSSPDLLYRSQRWWAQRLERCHRSVTGAGRRA